MEPSIASVPLRKKLADFIHDTSFEKLPQNVIHQTKLCLLDLIGVALAGSRQRVATIAHRRSAAAWAEPQVTVWGFDRRVPAAMGAMLNAVPATPSTWTTAIASPTVIREWSPSRPRSRWPKDADLTGSELIEAWSLATSSSSVWGRRSIPICYSADSTRRQPSAASPRARLPPSCWG